MPFLKNTEAAAKVKVQFVISRNVLKSDLFWETNKDGVELGNLEFASQR